MNCVTCQLEYLMDKTTMLDARSRRMHNVMDKGGLSAEVTDVQHANVREIQEFEAKWDAARCTHSGTGATTGEKVQAHEAGKGSASAVAVETPVANIGVNSLTTSRPTATNKPPQGNKAGRYVGSGGNSSGGRGKR